MAVSITSRKALHELHVVSGYPAGVLLLHQS